MTEINFPGQHTTTTSTTRVVPILRWDPTYAQTVPGYLKIGQIAFNFLGFLFIEFSGMSNYSGGNFFNFVAMCGFWFTGILLVFYLFHAIEKFYKIPWIKLELGFCTLWVFLYVIAATWAASTPNGTYAIAAFFGYCAMVLYGYDAWIKFQANERGEIAQGERHVTKITTPITPSSPAMISTAY